MNSNDALALNHDLDAEPDVDEDLDGFTLALAAADRRDAIDEASEG